MEPIVSIITTTYNIIENNQLDDLNILVGLLDRQTYPNIEHLVIDKSSNDGTVEILKEYKNKQYLNFYSEPDTGKFNAFNKGILHSKGKYLAFISCDDFYHDITAIQDLVQLMEAENADFSYSPAYCRHPEGFTFVFNPSIYNVFQVMPCPRQSMFFKRSALDKENYFDERFKQMSDFDLIIRLVMKKYKGVYFPKNYTTYKASKLLVNDPVKNNYEARFIFQKNYRNLYPLNEAILDNMVNTSDFPKELLEKLSTRFPENKRQTFFEYCTQMHTIRQEVFNKQSQQQLQSDSEKEKQ